MLFNRLGMIRRRGSGTDEAGHKNGAYADLIAVEYRMDELPASEAQEMGEIGRRRATALMRCGVALLTTDRFRDASGADWEIEGPAVNLGDADRVQEIALRRLAG